MFKLTILFLALTNANAGSAIAPIGELYSEGYPFPDKAACELAAKNIVAELKPKLDARLQASGVGTYYGEHVSCTVKPEAV